MDESRLDELLELDLEDRLTQAEKEELFRELRTSAAARASYWDVIEQHILTGAILSENRGRDLASLESDAPATAAEPVPTTSRSPRSRSWVWKLTLAAASCLALVLGWRYRSVEPTPTAKSPPPTSLATVLSVNGDVKVTDASGKSVAANLGSGLSVGQILRVGDDESHVEVLFADGTMFALQSGSTLRFLPPEANEGQRIHLDQGAVQIQTVANAGKGSFVVTTDHTRITSSATRFRVYREEHASRVELEEGKAHLESADGAKGFDLAEGSFVLATADREPVVLQSLAGTHCRLRHTFLRAGDAVAFSRDGSRIVTSHFARPGLKVWKSSDGSVVASAQGSHQRSHAMAFAADDTIVAICADGTAVLWKIGEPQPTLTRLRDKDLRAAAISPDGRWIAQASRSEVAFWEVDVEKGSLSHRRSLNARPSRVALSSVGPQAAVSWREGDLFAFDVATGRELVKHKLSRTPTPLALSADNRFLAAYAANDGLVLFDEHAGMRKTLWAGQGARIAHLNFSSDRQILLAGLEDGTVRAWATEDGRSLLVLDTGCRHVSQVTMSADRTLLATVGDNDCVKIWECNLP